MAHLRAFTKFLQYLTIVNRESICLALCLLAAASDLPVQSLLLRPIYLFTLGLPLNLMTHLLHQVQFFYKHSPTRLMFTAFYLSKNKMI